ncbi:NUDIX domain-containing protein [Actinoplanes sp. NPDC051411]|uniref:NUDIX hydrolase n=1 Tax=Actinoplanes sp. NPDC051411 TaxID=3155522 RepID=UPI00344A0B75
MPVSAYISGLRAHIGHGLLMLPSVSAVVRNEAGQVLLARRSDNGRWSVPAGVVDPGEQPAEAALRELFEETGVRAVIERIGGVATHPVVYPNGDRCEYLNVWFRCRAVGGQARVNDDESVEVAWFDPGALPDLDDWSKLRIDTTAGLDDPTWCVPPGEHHAGVSQPDAL